MIRAATALTLGCLLVAVYACGGGSGSSLRLLLEPDLSQLPAGMDRASVMTQLTDTLTKRAETYGASKAEVKPQDSDRLSVTLPGDIPKDEARRLLTEKIAMELRWPALDVHGNIFCQGEAALPFTVGADGVEYPSEGTPRLPTCRSGDRTGKIIWQDRNREGELPAVQPVSPERANVDRTKSPIVLLTFGGEELKKVYETTKELQGLPMGIFIDGELRAAPTVQEPVVTGVLAIADLNLTDANILAAQMTGGTLPVPVKVVDG